MFTIRWIAGNGSECLYKVPDVVNYAPANLSETKSAMVSFHDDRGGFIALGEGRIYVMNEKGATVARYILQGDAEFPHGFENKI